MLPPGGISIEVDGGSRAILFCAVDGGDIDGDNDIDLFFSNYDPSGPGRRTADVLLVNQLNETGTPRFLDQTTSRLGDLRMSAFGTGTQLRDMDRDGDVDIVKTSTLFSVAPWNDRGAYILYNDGNGEFWEFSQLSGTMPYMFDVADYDGDGLLDVYIVDDNEDSITFGYVEFDTTLGQYVVRHDESVSVTLDQNTSVTGGKAGNVKSADIDGDGDIDVGVASIDVQKAFANCDNQFALLANIGLEASNELNLGDHLLLPAIRRGGGTRAWTSSNHDLAFVDLDQDGDLEIFLGLCEGYQVLEIVD